MVASVLFCQKITLKCQLERTIGERMLKTHAWAHTHEWEHKLGRKYRPFLVLIPGIHVSVCYKNRYFKYLNAVMYHKMALHVISSLNNWLIVQHQLALLNCFFLRFVYYHIVTNIVLHVNENRNSSINNRYINFEYSEKNESFLVRIDL